MYCKHCLANNPPEATKCVQCGASLVDAVTGAQAAGAAAPTLGGLDLQEQPPIANPGFVASTPDPVIPGGPLGGPPPLTGVPSKPEVPAPAFPPENKMWAIGTIVGAVLGTPCACCTCWGVPSFFALIFGLLSLLESGKVKTFYDDKAYDAALDASKRTKTYAMIGLGILIGFIVVGFVLQLLLHGLSFMTNYQSYYNRG